MTATLQSIKDRSARSGITSTQDALRRIAALANASRCFIFARTDESPSKAYVDEWRRQAAMSELAPLISAGAFHWSVSRLGRSDHIYIPRMSELPPDALAFRDELLDHKVLRVLLVPILHAGKVAACIGLAWSNESSRNPCSIAPVAQLAGELLWEGSLCHRSGEPTDDEQNYRLIFENSLDAILLVKDSRIVECNARALEIYECGERNQLVGQSPLQVMPGMRRTGASPQKDTRHRFTAALRGEPPLFECIHQKLNGVEFPAEVTLSAFESRGHRYILAIVRDISPRKRAEQAAAERQAQFQILTEQALVGVSIIQAGRVAYANQAAADLAGYSLEEIYAWAPGELKKAVHCDDRARVMDLLHKKETGQTNRVTSYEYRLVKKCGQVHWVEQYSKAILHRGERAVIVTLIDRHDRILAEAALRELRAQAQLAVNGANLGTWDWDLTDGNVSTNQRWAELLGYTPEEVVANIHFWKGLVHPDDLQPSLAAFMDHLWGETDTYEIEHRLKHKSGEWIWVLYSGRIIERDSSGTPLRVCGVLLDLTERKRAEGDRSRLEGQLHQAQKMQSIGRLAGGVAHDFNNSLSVILGYSELLQQDPLLEPAHVEALQEIECAARKSQSLTQQLLTFSRKQIVRPQALDPNTQIETSIRMYRRLLDEDISIVFSPGDALPSILADTHQVDQVLANLLINARDAISASGETQPRQQVTIETSGKKLSAPFTDNFGIRPGDYVCLSVADTGSGMDQATKAKVFEPFFTTKRSGEGTGLGLATVFGVIGQNGGAIEVESEPGQGTTFYIYWPALDQPHFPKTPDSARVESPPGTRDPSAGRG